MMATWPASVMTPAPSVTFGVAASALSLFRRASRMGDSSAAARDARVSAKPTNARGFLWLTGEERERAEKEHERAEKERERAEKERVLSELELAEARLAALERKLVERERSGR